MFREFTLHPILGIPAIAWGGLFTLILLIITASIAVMNMKGNTAIPVKWHFILARITIILAIIHGVLAFLAFMH